MFGGAISVSAAIWPTPRADSSSTRNRVVSSARKAVHGWPSSLLNEPGGATTGPSSASTAASRSLVEVLPEEPVTPTTVKPPAATNRSTLARASFASADSTAAPEPSVSPATTAEFAGNVPGLGATTIAGTPTGRAASTATAPASTAAAA